MIISEQELVSFPKKKKKIKSNFRMWYLAVKSEAIFYDDWFFFQLINCCDVHGDCIANVMLLKKAKAQSS